MLGLFEGSFLYFSNFFNISVGKPVSAFEAGGGWSAFGCFRELFIGTCKRQKKAKSPNNKKNFLDQQKNGDVRFTLLSSMLGSKNNFKTVLKEIDAPNS